MIKLGKFQVGLAPLSMAVIFVLLSIFAVLSALDQVRPEWPMPLSSLLIINESLALAATLVYGILVHLVLSLIAYLRERRKKE